MGVVFRICIYRRLDKVVSTSANFIFEFQVKNVNINTLIYILCNCNFDTVLPVIIIFVVYDEFFFFVALKAILIMLSSHVIFYQKYMSFENAVS